MVNSNKKVVRKNIRMSPEVAEWYEKRAKEMGVSQSNLMVMALSEYIKQDKTIKMMSNLQEIIEKLERVESNSQNE